MKETKEGLYCGTTKLNGASYSVYQKNGHFALTQNQRFCGHVKQTKLRKAGIFCPVTKKKMYGQHGYVGCPHGKAA